MEDLNKKTFDEAYTYIRYIDAMGLHNHATRVSYSAVRE